MRYSACWRILALGLDLRVCLRVSQVCRKTNGSPVKKVKNPQVRVIAHTCCLGRHCWRSLVVRVFKKAAWAILSGSLEPLSQLHAFVLRVWNQLCLEKTRERHMAGRGPDWRAGPSSFLSCQPSAFTQPWIVRTTPFSLPASLPFLITIFDHNLGAGMCIICTELSGTSSKWLRCHDYFSYVNIKVNFLRELSLCASSDQVYMVIIEQIIVTWHLDFRTCVMALLSILLVAFGLQWFKSRLKCSLLYD